MSETGQDASRGRESAGAQRILEAAGRLFAERGFESVSLRDIALQAGVSHPLVYHYWRSKRELLAAVIADNQTRMRAIARQDLGTSAMIEDLARQNLAASRQYLLILTRAFADGLPVGDWPGGFPAVEAILERLGLDTPADHGDEAAGEARRLVAVVVALQLAPQLHDVGQLRTNRAERPVQSFGLH